MPSVCNTKQHWPSLLEIQFLAGEERGAGPQMTGRGERGLMGCRRGPDCSLAAAADDDDDDDNDDDDDDRQVLLMAPTGSS